MEFLLDDSLILPGEKIAVALSGGRDSVALLHALLMRAKAGDFTLKAIHVEHGIRGAESLSDQAFVQDLCARWNVELRCVQVDVLGNDEGLGSVEQTARSLRYRAFDQAVAEGFCDKVATAHHGGDNAETVLMRVFRGTGLTGLAGIKRARGAYVRPMLGATREQVDEYIKNNALTYVEDSTNSALDYTRNYVRGVIMPAVKERFASAEENVNRLGRVAAEADEFIRRQAAALLSVEANAVLISQTTEPLLIKYAVKLACEALGVFADVEERHLDVAVSAMAGGKKTYDLPNGIRLEREERGLSLCVPATITACIPAREGKNVVDGRVIVIERVKKRVEGALCFSADLGGLTLRGRREGDSFHRFGGGRKSLGDYWTDVKTPLRCRESAVLLTRASDVLVIVGTEIAEGVKVKDSSEKIYKISEEKYEEQH